MSSKMYNTKKTKKHITSRTLVLALSIIVIFSGALYGGYYVWNNRMQASAAGWTRIRDWDYTGGGHIVQKGCKTAIDSPYGPLYKVQIQTDNQSITWRGGTVLYNIRTNTFNNKPVNSWRNGRYQINTIYTSRIYNDKIRIGDTMVDAPTRGSFGPDYDPRNFTDC